MRTEQCPDPFADLDPRNEDDWEARLYQLQSQKIAKRERQNFEEAEEIIRRQEEYEDMLRREEEEKEYEEMVERVEEYPEGA